MGLFSKFDKMWKKRNVKGSNCKKIMNLIEKKGNSRSSMQKQMTWEVSKCEKGVSRKFFEKKKGLFWKFARTLLLCPTNEVQCNMEVLSKNFFSLASWCSQGGLGRIPLFSGLLMRYNERSKFSLGIFHSCLLTLIVSSLKAPLLSFCH